MNVISVETLLVACESAEDDSIGEFSPEVTFLVACPIVIVVLFLHSPRVHYPHFEIRNGDLRISVTEKMENINRVEYFLSQITTMYFK